MKKILILSVILASCHFSFAQKKQEKRISFLHTVGQDIVDESGRKVFLKSVGLGNWLLPEGYMWKFGELGDRPRKIEKIVADLIGKEKAATFWKIFRKNYITEADIKRIAELGFNSVRPALNARLFLTEGENPVYVEEGFQLIDSLVTWCKKYKLYVIIDMHAAPGGQTGANIDDSPNDIPELFIEKKYQDQLVDLWVKIAERYKNEPTVAAYDLLNEPLPINTGSAEKYKHLLEPLYKRITAAIRNVDQKHMITLEGFNWSNDWSLFTKPFDSNVFYQFHYYCWNRPDHLNGINDFLQKRNELNTPIWVGETGEKGNAIYWATTQLFESKNIGFSFWPWKKMDTQNTPYSIREPESWHLIMEYTNGGPGPESGKAETILNEFLENILLRNCVYSEEVTNAIFARVPGKIEAENYGQDGFNRSYFVLDTVSKSKYYRTGEPVKIILDNDGDDQVCSGQSIELQSTEWTMYSFENPRKKRYPTTLRVSASGVTAEAEVWINGKKLKLKIGDKEAKELVLGNLKFKTGINTIKVLVKSGVLKLDWIRIG